MLFDFLDDLLTPCPRRLQRSATSTNCAASARQRLWASAAAPTRTHRAFLLAAMGRCARRRKAVLLGSGWLNDVPLAELAAVFREVVLVDAVHPRRSARRQVRHRPTCSSSLYRRDGDRGNGVARRRRQGRGLAV